MLTGEWRLGAPFNVEGRVRMRCDRDGLRVNPWVNPLNPRGPLASTYTYTHSGDRVTPDI